MLTHEQKVYRISQQLKRRKSTKPVSLKKKAVPHQVPKPRDKRYSDDKIDISDLNKILLIDKERQICIAEPGVTFVDLIKETLKRSLVPTVVPELKTITVGGAVAGCSIESMSYKYGGFHDSCLEYEVITAKGEVLTCSPAEKNKLLFQMMHGTFGTLGIISKLTFKLIPAKKYVKVVYEKYNTLEDYKAAIWRHYGQQDADFMDGIIHSPKLYVLSIGTFVEKAPYANSYDWMKIYYLSTKRRKVDYLKTIDYFFRYDKGVTNVNPQSFIGRLLFGKFINSTRVLWLARKFHKIIPPKMIPVTLDVFIPFSKAGSFMRWYQQEVDFFPLWCVPYKAVRRYEWISKDYWNCTKDQLFLDLAIYGLRRKGCKNYYKILEEGLMKVGGLKTLISTNYYTEEEFWKIWNKQNYVAVKKQTDPQGLFRDLYTKMCKTARGAE